MSCTRTLRSIVPRCGVVLSACLALGAPAALAQSAVPAPADSRRSPTAFTAPFDTRAQTPDADGDGDGLPDAWESLFGLNASDPADASTDADADGRTNTQEYLEGTHPGATPVRYYAEGASSTFFRTTLALFNLATTAAVVNVRFLGPAGVTVSVPVAVPAQTPSDIDVAALRLPFDEFSMVVESPPDVVTERTMTWGQPVALGGHSGTGVAAPARTWHFAEGATTSSFQTFYLLLNPGAIDAHVVLRYLLGDGRAHQRTHVVPARSRQTIWVNQEGPPLDAAEFGLTLTSDQPLVAERAMYRDAGGQPFAAGSVAAGVSEPSSRWHFAEGATGPVFDTFLLVSNPGEVPAAITARYLRAVDLHGILVPVPLVSTHVVPPGARLTIWVSRMVPGLEHAEFATVLQADRPIVAERSMWWPGPTPATWRETHGEAGAPATSTAWAVPDVPVDAAANGRDTFLIIQSTDHRWAARAQVTLACADGTRVSRELDTIVDRVTVWLRHAFPETVGRRCGATVTSLPVRTGIVVRFDTFPMPLVVERSTYSQGFAVGTVSRASPTGVR